MTDPRQAVLIYDGHCRFCIREAARIQRWVGNPLRLESFRDRGGIDRYPGLFAEQCEAALQLVAPDGRIHSGAAAVFRALALNPRLAPVTWIYLIPGLRQLFDAGYRMVARNRFRLQGQACPDGTCRTHGQAREPPSGRAVVRDLFLRALGVIFLVAFVSLYVQGDVLYGSHGGTVAAHVVNAPSSRYYARGTTGRAARPRCADSRGRDTASGDSPRTVR